MSSEFVVVSKERHSSKSWRKVTNFGFASGTNLVPVSSGELSHVTLSYPLVFVADGAQQQTLVAMLGMLPGQNFFLRADGQWIGDYVPAALRGYPFQLVRSEQDEFTLVVNEASGLVADGREGVPFFDGDSAEPHTETKALLNFLHSYHQGLKAAASAVAAIEAAGLIEPWPLNIETAEGVKPVGGVGRISEARLGALPIEELDRLRQTGGLMVAYAQLFSMQNLRKLQLLAQMKAAEPANKAVAPLGLASLDDEKFDWSTILDK